MVKITQFKYFPLAAAAEKEHIFFVKKKLWDFSLYCVDYAATLSSVM